MLRWRILGRGREAGLSIPPSEKEERENKKKKIEKKL